MSRTPRTVSGLLAVALTLLAVAGCGAQAALSRVDTEERSFSETFPDTPGEVLRLSNLAGTVELVPGEGDQVVVEATVHARGRNAAETRELLEAIRWEERRDLRGREGWSLTYPVDRHKRFHINGEGWGKSSRVRYRGRKVKVSTHRRSGDPTLYVDLRIVYPGGGALALHNLVGDIRGGDLQGSLSLDTGSGDVELGDFSGELEVDTGSGDVRLGAVRGETQVDTGSGDVRVRELVGNGSLDTGSGNIAVGRVAMGRLKVDTGSGNILVEDGSVGELEADTGSGEIRILGVDVGSVTADTGSGDVVLESPLLQARRIDVDTGSGDVRIQAAAAAAFDIHLETGSGELLVRYDDAELRRSGRRVVGASRGRNGTQISVETGSGNCVIGPA